MQGSTTCGIKIFRLQILFIFIKNQIKKLIYPNTVVILNYNNQKIEDSFINSVIFIFAYLFLFLIIAMLLSISGLDFLSAISGAATSISNVGPGLGEMIGPNGNFGEVSNVSKWILSFGMLLGRLEIFAVLVLFYHLSGDHKLTYSILWLWKFIKKTFKDSLKFTLIKECFEYLLLGIISGFPWVLIGSSLSLWLKEDGLKPKHNRLGWIDICSLCV